MKVRSVQRVISRLSNKVRRRLDVLSDRYGALTGAEGRVLNYLLSQENIQFQKDVMVQVATAIALLLGEGEANYISLKLGAGGKEKASRAMAAGIVSLFGVGIII